MPSYFNNTYQNGGCIPDIILNSVSFLVQPGVFPNSLRGYVERAFARCKDDMQKAACQAIMKEVCTLVNEKLTCASYFNGDKGMTNLVPFALKLVYEVYISVCLKLTCQLWRFWR